MPSFFRRINRVYLAISALVIMALFFTSRVILRFRDPDTGLQLDNSQSDQMAAGMNGQQTLALCGLEKLQQLKLVGWRELGDKRQSVLLLLDLPEERLEDFLQQQYWRGSSLQHLQDAGQLRQGVKSFSDQAAEFKQQLAALNLQAYRRGVLVSSANKNASANVLWLIDNAGQMRGILVRRANP